MNIRDLKYLISIEDHNHFGKAADACFVSQSALNMQIKKLEDSIEKTSLNLLTKLNEGKIDGA